MSVYESKSLREERGKVVTELQGIARAAKEAGREMSAEEQQKFDQLYDQQKQLEARAQSATRVEMAEELHEVRQVELAPNVQRRAPASPSMITDSERELALRAWLLTQARTELRNDFQVAADKCGVNLNGSIQQFQFPRLQAWWQRGSGQSEGTWPQNSTSGSAGGFLVQQSEIIREIDVALKYYAGIRRACRAIRTAQGMTYWFPTVTDISNVASIHTELAAPDETDFAFNHVQIPVFTYDTAAYPISVELMQDVALPILEIISELIGVRVGRKQNTDFTTGNGSNAPTGLSTAIQNSGTVFTTNASGTCVYADINNFIYKLNKAYRDLPSTAIMASDDWLRNAYSLVDSNNRPLVNFSMDAIDNMRESILGWKVVVNNDLSSVSAGNYCAIFGPMEKGIVRDAQELQLRVLQEYFLATNLGIGVIAWMRSGFACVNPLAFTIMLIHA